MRYERFAEETSNEVCRGAGRREQKRLGEKPSKLSSAGKY